MKLVKITCHAVVVPTREGTVHSREYGAAYFDESPKFILEAETDDGLIGLGETPRGLSQEALERSIDHLRGAELMRLCFQEPPVHGYGALADMYAQQTPGRPHRPQERRFNTYDEQAVHTMLLDLLGKRLGVSIHVLLGGAYRDRVLVDYWMGRMTPADSAGVCLDAKARGFVGVKCKCALEDDLVERAQAVYDACGADFKITFDANMRFYRPGEAMPMLKRLAAVGNIGCVEDPFPRTRLDWFVRLRAQELFPIALHTGYNATFHEAIRMDACDYANLSDLPWCVRKAGAMAWLAGIPTWHGSGIDLGITEAMYIHVVAATKSMTLPSDILGRCIREHNLITDALPVTEGTVAVPQGPGLGITLDRQALDRYTTRRFTIDL